MLPLATRPTAFLAEHGLELLDVFLDNTPHKLKYVRFRCTCGATAERIAARLTHYFPGCHACAHKDKSARDPIWQEVSTHLEKAGAVLLSIERDRKNTHVHYRCACGKVAQRRRNQLLEYEHVDCEDCRIARLPRGPYAPGWDPLLTDEERKNKHGAGPHQAWARRCLRRDDYRCQITGYTSEQEPLCVHHLYSFRRYPQLRFEDSNGVTLTRSLHLEFHATYSRKTFSYADFAEFYLAKSGRSFTQQVTLE